MSSSSSNREFVLTRKNIISNFNCSNQNYMFVTAMTKSNYYQISWIKLLSSLHHWFQETQNILPPELRKSMNELQSSNYAAFLQDKPATRDTLLIWKTEVNRIFKCEFVGSTFRRLRRKIIALSVEPESTLFLSLWTSISSSSSRVVSPDDDSRRGSDKLLEGTRYTVLTLIHHS